MIFTGIVENRDDELKLGRAKVRIVGIHTPDKTLLPTDSLPWAMPLNSITSASMNGIGNAPVGVVQGSTVLVVFADEDKQVPIMLGTLGGIPTNESVQVEEFIPTENESVAVSTGKIDPTIIVTPTESNIGVAALNKAMNEFNITSKYARASVLGICQVESNFKPVAENLNYSADGLLATFPSVFKNDRALAESIARNPERIGEVVYGLGSPKARELGNKTVSDGFRYRGRGYVQLTGRANYAKYSTAAGVDLVSNPDSLLTDDVSAKVAVAYFKDRVAADEENPSYINSAIKAVGLNRPDIREKKFNAYQYWLGESPPVSQTDRNEVPQKYVKSDYGFSDPDTKYPLDEYLNEPDTNRLARGDFEGTIVSRKDKNRVLNVPTSAGFAWSQPVSPYNAVYPFNKVFETESGLLTEFDDTPNNERIHTYHRKGTFDEIDCNGSKTTRIVGDSYEILDRNGFLYIKGKANITVAGDINILTQSNSNIQVYGNSNINVHGNATTNVAGNFSTNVGGTYNVKAENINLESSSMNIVADIYKLSSNNADVIHGSLTETIEGESSYRWEGNTSRFIGANTINRHNVGADFNCPADPPRANAVGCLNVDSADSANDTGLGSAIRRLTPLNSNFAPLNTPIRNADELFSYETPEEQAENPREPIPDAMPETQSAPVEKVVKQPTPELPPSCETFKTMEEFPKSLIIYTDTTGYNWTIGKVTLFKYKIEPVTIKGVEYSKADIVCNLKSLCENVLGPLNEKLGRVDTAWSITSCFRDRTVKGAKTSQHLIGQAVDVSIGGNYNFNTTYDWAKELSKSINSDQFLLEYRDTNEGRIIWIHMSYSSKGNRNQVLTFLNDRTNAQGLKKLA